MPFQFLTLHMLPVSFPPPPLLSLVFLNFIVKCFDVGSFLIRYTGYLVGYLINFEKHV